MDEAGLVSINPALFNPVSFNKIRVASRVGNVSRALLFPDGGLFESDNHDGLDEWLVGHKRHSDWAHVLESKISFVLGAMMFIFVFTVICFTWGIPKLSEYVANVLPASVNNYIGQNALESMDKILFDKSEISEDRRIDLINQFNAVVPDDEEEIQYTLVFRKSDEIGANAFALPNGTVVITDELIELAYKDEEIMSILLHEIGHVVHRHSL